jgi:hypothetical protein
MLMMMMMTTSHLLRTMSRSAHSFWSCYPYNTRQPIPVAVQNAVSYPKLVFTYSTSNAAIRQPYASLLVWQARTRNKTATKVLMFNTFGMAGSLPHYPPEISRRWKIFIGCKPVFVLTNQVFWVIVLCDWVMTSRCFEGTYRLHLQGYESVNWLIPPRLRGFFSPKRRKGITQTQGATTQKNRFLKNLAVEISNNSLPTVKNIFISECVLLVHHWFYMKEWNNESCNNIRKSMSMRL